MPICLTALRNLTSSLLQHAHRLDPLRDWEILSIILVDDAAMHDAHACYFGINETTDVISQYYKPLPGERGCTGEIIVNVEQALRNAPRSAMWPPEKELSLYIAHGLDHLHGGLDDTPTQRQQMRRRELRWLRQLHSQGFDFRSLNRKRV